MYRFLLYKPSRKFFKPPSLCKIMSEKHRMSITPRGTLTDLVETVFRGKGNPIAIAGREYTFREYGSLSEQDPVRASMLRGLENQARISPGIRYSNEVELGKEEKGLAEPTLKIRYVKSEAIPNPEEDKGTHQYMIIEGTRYRVEINGNAKVMGITVDEIMQQGRQMILAYQKRHGKIPNGIEVEHTLKRETKIGPFRFKNKY